MATSSSERIAPRALPRVLVVEDSALMRALICSVLEASGEFEVVGQASTGYEAIRLVHEIEPDIVTLDLEMPDLGGLDALGYIMTETPRAVVIVSSHLETLAAGMRAVDYGAVELVEKPADGGDEGVAAFRERLLDALRAARVARLENLRIRLHHAGPQRKRWLAAARLAAAERPACAVAIAASTGGPRALVSLVPRLPADLPAAVFVVQHMPAPFTRYLAERLDGLSPLPVREARAGDEVRSGVVTVAPGGYHLGFERTEDGLRIALEESAPVLGLRPAADVLFASMARHFGPRSIGIVLTGMGRDGTAGLRAVQEVGGWTAVQDEDTAVIGSMPRAAAAFAAASLTVEAIADAIGEHATRLALLYSG